MVEETDDLMIIEDGGVMIRMPVSDVNVYKRDTQGVIIMRVEDGSKVISIEKVDAGGGNA